MSYDIYLNDPNTGETVEFDEPLDVRGGTFCVGGTTEAWLNITWNYGTFFRDFLDEKEGIRWLYGKPAKDTLERLRAAVDELGTDRAPDYWEASAGNAGAALANLIAIGEKAPEGIWSGD